MRIKSEYPISYNEIIFRSMIKIFRKQLDKFILIKIEHRKIYKLLTGLEIKNKPSYIKLPYVYISSLNEPDFGFSLIFFMSEIFIIIKKKI